MAAKNTSTIIPMCHPLPLTGIDVQFNWQINDNTTYTLNITAIVSTTGKTGVEMEGINSRFCNCFNCLRYDQGSR